VSVAGPLSPPLPALAVPEEGRGLPAPTPSYAGIWVTA
jgi:hypothetical protein